MTSQWRQRPTASGLFERFFAVTLLLSLLGLAGCGSSNPSEPKRYTVSGTLHTTDDKPAAGATVTLNPTDGAKLEPMPFAVVGGDGKFTIGGKTLGDGAPAGSYAVTVVWRSVIPSENPEDKLRGRYGDPKKPLTTITVKESDNDLGALKLK
jgi:hypothetical protein